MSVAQLLTEYTLDCRPPGRNTLLRVPTYREPIEAINCVMLSPEEHELLPARTPTPVEAGIEDFQLDADTPGLALFLQMIDDCDMGHSVDLIIWVARWRAA